MVRRSLKTKDLREAQARRDKLLEQRVANLVADIARSMGYGAAAVNNRRGFMEAYTPEIPCVVLELAMPDFDGMEVISHLRRTGSQASLIIMSSASDFMISTARRLADAIGLHVAAVLDKPFGVDDLTAALADACGVRNALPPRPFCAPCEPCTPGNE
jgi:CheY-like chemotaxis protein